MSRTKKKKRQYAPEVLARLRASMAKAREARTAKKNLSVPVLASDRPATDSGRSPDEGLLGARESTPATVALKAKADIGYDSRGGQNLSGVGHVTHREVAEGKVHSPQETAAPDLLKREMSLPYSETMSHGLPPQVMSVANIEAIWAAGQPTHGLELQAPDYTEPKEGEIKTCPKCNAETVWHEDQWQCLNPDCHPTYHREYADQEKPYSEPTCTAELTVTKLVQNPRILLATTPLLVGEQHVIVGNSENFIVGMKIPVIRNPPNPAYWLLNGPLPRSRGRW